MAATIDLEKLAGTLADSLQEPTYVVSEDVAPDGFARFETVIDSTVHGEVTVRATVTLVSDGEDAIVVEDAAGEVFEIVVRRVSA